MPSKTFVGTTVTRLVADNEIPDTPTQSILATIISGGTLSGILTENLTHSSVFAFEKAYRYGRSGDYHYGLPDTRITDKNDEIAAVKPVIEAEVGYPIEVNYAFLGGANYMHWGRRELVENYGYDFTTNEVPVLSAQKGYTVYLDDIVPNFRINNLEYHYDAAELSNFSSSGQSGYTPERPALDNAELSAKVDTYNYTIDPNRPAEVVFKFIWADENNTFHREEIAFDMTPHDPPNKEYVHVHYRYQDESFKEYEGYWIYDPDTQQHPEIDALRNFEYVNPGTFFPFIFFRHHKTSRYADNLKDTAEYQSLDKICDMIGIDFADMGAQLEKNPDIGDVEQAFLFMGCPAKGTNAVEAEYLHRYFKRIAKELPRDEKRSYRMTDPRILGSISQYYLFLGDAGFQYKLNVLDVSTYLVSGNIGPVGTYTKQLDDQPVQVSYDGVLYINSNVPNIILLKQVSENAVEVVLVQTPQLTYVVRGDYKEIVRANDDAFLIPLDYDVCREMSLIKREELYNRCLHFQFNHLVRQEYEWYESPEFAFILKVAAAAVAIFFSVELGAQLYLAITGAVAATAVVKYIVVRYLLSVLVEELAEVIVDEIGAEAAAVLAVAITLWQAAKGAQGIQFNQPFTVGDVLKADGLLILANGLQTAANEAQIALLLDLQQDYEAFTDQRDRQQDELDRALDLLNADSLIDPTLFVDQQPMVLFGESPSTYFQRSIHSGNIGAKSFDMLHSYHDEALSLPTLNDTLGARHEF